MGRTTRNSRAIEERQSKTDPEIEVLKVVSNDSPKGGKNRSDKGHNGPDEGYPNEGDETFGNNDFPEIFESGEFFGTSEFPEPSFENNDFFEDKSSEDSGNFGDEFENSPFDNWDVEQPKFGVDLNNNESKGMLNVAKQTVATKSEWNVSKDDEQLDSVNEDYDSWRFNLIWSFLRSKGIKYLDMTEQDWKDYYDYVDSMQYVNNSDDSDDSNTYDMYLKWKKIYLQEDEEDAFNVYKAWIGSSEEQYEAPSDNVQDVTLMYLKWKDIIAVQKDDEGLFNAYKAWVGFSDSSEERAQSVSDEEIMEEDTCAKAEGQTNEKEVPSLSANRKRLRGVDPVLAEPPTPEKRKMIR